MTSTRVYCYMILTELDCVGIRLEMLSTEFMACKFLYIELSVVLDGFMQKDSYWWECHNVDR